LKILLLEFAAINNPQNQYETKEEKAAPSIPQRGINTKLSITFKIIEIIRE